MQVRHYVKGALYGLLSRREMRLRAREYAMEQKLQVLQEKLGRNFQRQIKYLLRLLSKPDKEGTDESDVDHNGGGGHDDDDVEEENYVCTDDLPENGHVVEYGMTSDMGTGEELLCRLYAIQDDSPRYQSRQMSYGPEPLTPSQFKSLRLKTKAGPPPADAPKSLSPVRRSFTDSTNLVLSPIEQQQRPQFQRSKSSVRDANEVGDQVIGNKPSMIIRQPSDTSKGGHQIHPMASPPFKKIETLDEEFAYSGRMVQRSPTVQRSPAASFAGDMARNSDSGPHPPFDPFRRQEKLNRTAPLGSS
mmetsp:Transcript_23341/g.30329  ORF Transcript_23341/g.30329 Transcript_23341/m.30329 type:complete len:303 (+) Transcript_23341:1-909(+)